MSKNNELRFQNEFILEKNFLREFFRLTMSKGYSAICYIFFGAVLIFSLIVLLNGGAQNIPMLLFLLCISIYGLSFPVSRVNLNAKNLLKQYAVLSSGGTAGIRVLFHNSEFNSNVYGRENTFSYTQISKVVSGKLGLYFHIEKSLYVMLKKDAFTVGDYDSFVVFLREKLKDNPKALKRLR